MTKAPVSLQDLRRSLYVKAKTEPSWRFWGLYVHICKVELAPQLTAVQECVREYCQYLDRQRGLSVKSLPNYLSFVEQFLHEKFAQRELRFDVLRAQDVRITTRLALQWATQPQNLQPAEWAARLSAVRAFARYWRDPTRRAGGIITHNSYFQIWQISSRAYGPNNQRSSYRICNTP